MGNCFACGASNAPEYQSCTTCGAPPTPPAALPAPADPSSLDEELGRTMIRPSQSASRHSGPTLVLDDGQRVALETTILLGRSPRDEEGAVSISLADPERTVSKTHLRVTRVEDGILVTDLNSTNGVRISLPHGSDLWLRPSEPSPLGPGARVHFGVRSFIVEAPPAPERGSTASPVRSVGRATPPVRVEERALPQPPGLIASVPLDPSDPMPPQPVRAQLRTASATTGTPTPDHAPYDPPPRLSGAADPDTVLRRITGHLEHDAGEVSAELDISFGFVTARAIEEVASAVRLLRVNVAAHHQPRLVPAFILPGVGGRFLGEGGTGRMRRRQALHPAVLVGLGDDILVTVLPDDGVTQRWMARSEVSKVARVTMKRRRTVLRGLEWGYQRVDGSALERVVVVLPADVPNGDNGTWQARIHTMLTGGATVA